MIVDIDFNGNLLAEVEVKDNKITVLRAVNGFGEVIDCEKIQIHVKL